MLLAGPSDSSSREIEQSITTAKGGSQSALGALLDLYRGYLWTVANEKLRTDIQAKVAPSDLVQETLTKAVQTFDRFRGTTDAELKVWLGKILAGTTTDGYRRFLSRKRDVTLEVSLADRHGSDDPVREIPSPSPTPSSHYRQTEEAHRVQAALETLSLHDRQIIELRNFQELEFAVIATQMNRSVTETKRRWAQAIQALAALLERPDAFDSARPR